MRFGKEQPIKDDRPQLEIPAPPPPDEDWREHPEGHQPKKEERGVVIIGPDGSEQGEKKEDPKKRHPGEVDYRC
jgi:hypothetical protein